MDFKRLSSLDIICCLALAPLVLENNSSHVCLIGIPKGKNLSVRRIIGLKVFMGLLGKPYIATQILNNCIFTSLNIDWRIGILFFHIYLESCMV